MPMKTPTSRRKALPPELLDELMNQVDDPAELLGNNGLLSQIQGALIERALQAEMTHHLGYEPGQTRPTGTTNERNGTSKKTVLTGKGEVEVTIPRDREASFEPQILPKYARRLPGFDDKVIYLYSQGLSDRQIVDQIKTFYNANVSPQLISSVTDAVIDEMKAWRHRPLKALYPILYLDCIFVSIRAGGLVTKHAIYVILGIDEDGHKDVLGLYVAPTEGAKFWLGVLNELKNRGVQDILIACVDGLKGFPEAIEAAFPKTTVQTCIVHQIRNSLKSVSWSDRRAVAASLKPVYQAVSEEAGLEALEDFEAEWGETYPMIGRSWLSNWDRLSPFFAFPEAIRKAIYTTNPIEGLNRQLRKVLKTKGALPSEQAALKLMYLAILRIQEKWTYPRQNWKQAMHQFAIFFEGRVNL